MIRTIRLLASNAGAPAPVRSAARTSTVAVGVLLAIVLGSVPLRAADTTVPLPVRKVMLFKNGIGYFEHSGDVRGAGPIELVLPSAQLNDVLKSLTVIDRPPSQVTGVTYESAPPLDRRLAEVPVKLDTVRDLVGFLNQVRGAEVEVSTPGGAVKGRLLGAQVRKKQVGDATVDAAEAVLFAASGEVRTIELASVSGLRLLRPELVGDVDRYLRLLDGGRERDVRRLRIQTSGGETRPLSLSYTSEAPIWKTTYRIVVDGTQRLLLQGWALVDNASAMDWTDVELSLVAGAPISFIQDLSRPLYARRPIVPLPQGVQVTPQTHEGAVLEQRPEPARLGLLAPPTPASAAPASGAMAQSRVAAQPPVAPVVAAEAGKLGDQFEYRIPRPVTIQRNQSALLPIVHTTVEGEKVSIASGRGERHPRLAIALTNSSGLTLDAGSFVVIDAGAFAGEGLAQTVQPGERRLLSYGVDLGVEVVTGPADGGTERIERVEAVRGVMRFSRRAVERTGYTLRNNDERPRVVLVEHPRRPAWTLTSPTAPAETTASAYRFRVDSTAKSTVVLVVTEETVEQTTYALSDLGPDQISTWLKQRAIDPVIERALGPIVAKKSEIAEVAATVARLDAEETGIFRDQERLRTNLGRLGQSPEEAALRQRYVRQLDQQEQRLAALRAERERLQRRRTELQGELEKLVGTLTFDRRL